MTANEKLLAWCSKHRKATIHIGGWIDPCCPSYIELSGGINKNSFHPNKKVIINEYDVIGEDSLDLCSSITIDQLIEKALEEWNKK